MKKAFLLLSFIGSGLILVNMNLCAQASYDLIQGPVLTTKPDADVVYFGIEEGKVYKMGTENKILEYQCLGSSMAPEATAPVLSSDDKTNKRMHAFSVMLNGEICKFTYTSDKKAMGFHLFAQRVNKQTLLSEGDVKEIAFAKVDDESLLTSMIDPSRFAFPYKVSNDKSAIAVLTYETVGANSYGTYAEIRMIDNTFNEHWKRKVNINKVGFAGMNVFDQDQLLVFWRAFVPEEGKSPISYQRISKDNETVSLTIDLGKKQAQHMLFFMDKNKQIVVFGFYQENDVNVTKGFFLFHINSSTLEVTDKIITPVDFPVAKDGENSSQVIENVKVLDNGDILLVSQQIIQETTLPQSGVVGTTTIYTCQDISIFRLNSKAEILWKSTIPLKQLAYDDYSQFAGAVSLVKGDTIFILLNDNEKNAGITNTKSGTPVEYHTKRDGQLFLLTVNGSGDISREAFSSDIEDMKLNTSQSFAMSDNTLLLYTEAEKKYQIDKVVFH